MNLINETTYFFYNSRFFYVACEMQHNLWTMDNLLQYLAIQRQCNLCNSSMCCCIKCFMLQFGVHLPPRSKCKIRKSKYKKSKKLGSF